MMNSPEQEVVDLLDELTSSNVHNEPVRLAGIRHRLGAILGRRLARSNTLGRQGVCVVCAVEDADDLAAGVIDALEVEGFDPSKVFLQCYWNTHVVEFGDAWLATVSDEYCEAFDPNDVTYVFVTPIATEMGSMRSNLKRMLTNSKNAPVVIITPFLDPSASQFFNDEFQRDLESGFQFIHFAYAVKQPDGFSVRLTDGSNARFYPISKSSGHLRTSPDIIERRRSI